MSNEQKPLNFLDFVFLKTPGISHEISGEDRITLLYRHTGFFAFIAQKLFKRPKVTRIELDELGSFIWSSIDGKKNVYELGQLMKESFGDKAEPLYERLFIFVKQLHRLGFIQLNTNTK